MGLACGQGGVVPHPVVWTSGRSNHQAVQVPQSPDTRPHRGQVYAAVLSSFLAGSFLAGFFRAGDLAGIPALKTL